MSAASANGHDWPGAILFDLDGTLIDSVPDIAAAVNELLPLYGLEPLGVDQVRKMVGEGVRKLVERAFAARGVKLDKGDLDERHGRMMTIYGKHLTGRTELMAGAGRMLADYHRGGVKLAVVTNKPEGFTRIILDHFGLSDMIGAVVGGDTCADRKPEPGMLYHTADLLHVDKDDCVMVGDSPADIDAARNAGIRSVAVRGGYSRVPVDELGADIVIDTLADLPGAIAAMKSSAA
ncbi:phosphoglycolate phosphatase [Pseudohoeflea suaedae]|uniref:Phosphoglycolate phosphatase n=1 Tax=Pseudohoeflea suaedae TaxID=877384 RepID=A0A4R5PJV0_9HYPH|nr:phosphoglycolate phosphatase [Pseudohoeflea suaedae]TDH35967.1 phosphoglycolate phosphatase [Pseudohoeflea suaedae]